MRILKLHHPTGHPYWDRDEYKVEMPDGSMLDLRKYAYYNNQYNLDYRLFVNENGVWFQECASGQGFGRKDITRLPTVLVVEASQYDTIEYVGVKLEISENLKNDLMSNGLL